MLILVAAWKSEPATVPENTKPQPGASRLDAAQAPPRHACLWTNTWAAARLPAICVVHA
jgi:hypothetical protein